MFDSLSRFFCPPGPRTRRASRQTPRRQWRVRPGIEVLENRVTPTVAVQFALASESLLESAGTFTIPVVLSSTSATATSVPFTLGGSAVSGTDYSGVTASPVVIPAGQKAVNITGTLLDDGAPDAPKTLTFTLGSPTGATLGATAVNTLTIAEPAAGPATLAIADSSAIEPAPGGTVNMVFTVTRGGDLTSRVTVGFTTVAGTAQPSADFTPTTGTTTFAAGAATATVSIPIFGNGVVNNPSLTFSVQLTGVTDVVGPAVTFASQSTLGTGTGPNSVAVGDVNGDGKPDLVVAKLGNNQVAGTVSVLLNTTTPGAATPSFATQQAFATGSLPFFVAVGDVNGDGKPDLLVANENDNTVSVLLNTTTPGATTASFATQQTFATGVGPRSVALGDVNGDGKPDLVTANHDDNNVSVLLNTATPGASTVSFATQRTFATGADPQVAALGDVNGDGKPDIVVDNFVDNTVSVLLNTTTTGATTLSFATQQTFATGNSIFDVVLGDVNGDGKPDLVVPNSGDNTASVLLNTTTPGAATASFATQQTFATGSGPFAVVLMDVNGDGKPDLLVANDGDNTVSVLRNTTTPGTATPSFATQQTFATGHSPLSLALGDVNGDGKPDLVAANENDNTLSVLLNTTVLPTATPAFLQAATPAAGSGPINVAVGDVNGDGKPDLVVANDGGTSGTVSVLLSTTTPGASTPTFATQQTFAAGAAGRHPRWVAVGDVNGDGMPDIILPIGDDNTLSVLPNTTAPGATTASFATQQTFATGGDPQFVAVGDVNGDGKPDLVVANFTTRTVSVLLNTTTGSPPTLSFATQQTFATGVGTFSVALGDVNGDGKPDLVVPNEFDNTVSVLLNTTTGSPPTLSFAPQQTFAAGSAPRSVAVADVNGDGRPDLVVENFGDSTVSVLLNTTTGSPPTLSFAPQQTFAAGVNPYYMAVGDVNGDGKPDLAVTNAGTGGGAGKSVSVLLNTTAPGATAPSFATQQTFATGDTPIGVALGDVNGDGKPDILAANYHDNTVSVLLNAPVTIPGNLATGTITDSDSAGVTAQFSTAGETLDETAGTFSIMVTLSAASASATSIPFTLGGTAVAGADYNGITATPLVIGAGQTSGVITGTLLDDGLYGGSFDKTLTVTLGTPTGATLGAPAANTLTINEITARPSFPGLTAQERYIQALYLDELGRPGAKAELDGWVAALNGPGGAAAVVNGIKNSAEGRDHLVKSWYQLFLGRPAAGGEEQSWVNGLLAGSREEDMLAGILGSPEFYQRAQTLVSGGSADQRFVQTLYQLLLYRTASPGEVAGFVSALPASGRTGVALAFLQSAEFRADLIEGYYNGLLHRSSDAMSLSAWVNSGLDLSTVRADFETTPEFMSNG